MLAGGLVALALPVNIGASQSIQERLYVNAGRLLKEGAYLATFAEPGITL